MRMFAFFIRFDSKVFFLLYYQVDLRMTSIFFKMGQRKKRVTGKLLRGYFSWREESPAFTSPDSGVILRNASIV